MNRFRPWSLAGLASALAIVALSVVVLFGRSGAVRAQQPRSPDRLVPVPVTGFPNFVKAGKHYINLDRINYTNEPDGDRLSVHLGGGDTLVLNKDDAATLRKAIEAGAK